jgi:hypothetical protein
MSCFAAAIANRGRSYDDRDDVPNDPAKNLTKRFGMGAFAGMKPPPGQFSASRGRKFRPSGVAEMDSSCKSK